MGKVKIGIRMRLGKMLSKKSNMKSSVPSARTLSKAIEGLV